MDPMQLSKSSLDLLEQLLGCTGLSMYTTTLIVRWGESAMAPSLSINISRPDYMRWIVMESEEWGNLNLITVREADHPADVPYVDYPAGGKILRDPMSDLLIRSENESPLTAISVLEGQAQLGGQSGADTELVWDHTLLFEFDNGQRFAISAESALATLLEFTTDPVTISDLLEKSRVRFRLANHLSSDP
jgi:hypothetical protein